MFSRFFEGKAIEHLIGPGVKSSDLNDDKLGIVMEKLYAAGIGEIFVEVVLGVLKKSAIEIEYAPERCNFNVCSWRVQKLLSGGRRRRT